MSTASVIVNKVSRSSWSMSLLIKMKMWQLAMTSSTQESTSDSHSMDGQTSQEIWIRTSYYNNRPPHILGVITIMYYIISNLDSGSIIEFNGSICIEILDSPDGRLGLVHMNFDDSRMSFFGDWINDSTYSERCTTKESAYVPFLKVWAIECLNLMHWKRNIYTDDVFIATIDTKRYHRQTNTSIYNSDLLSNKRHTIKFTFISDAIGINGFCFLDNKQDFDKIENSTIAIKKESNKWVSIKGAGETNGTIRCIIMLVDGSANGRINFNSITRTIYLFDDNIEKIVRIKTLNYGATIDKDLPYSCQLAKDGKQSFISFKDRAEITIIDIFNVPEGFATRRCL